MSRKLIRYRDLKERDIVHNWPTLRRWIKDPKIAFPPGFMLGPQSRVWFEDEIDAWLEERSRLAVEKAA